MQNFDADDLHPKKGENNQMIDRSILGASVLIILSFAIFRSRHGGLLGMLIFTVGSTFIPAVLALGALLIAKIAIKRSSIFRMVYLSCYLAIVYWFFTRIR